MAIQVNGTTVINNSRQLTNIASVDAATVTALGNAGVGGGSAPTWDPSSTPDVTYTSSSTWSKPGSLGSDDWVVFYMVGGGGAGSTSSWATGGNGASAYVFAALAGSLPSSITFTVGAGGAGGSSGENAPDGGDTTASINGRIYKAFGGYGALGKSSNYQAQLNTEVQPFGSYTVPFDGTSPYDYDGSATKGGQGTKGPSGGSYTSATSFLGANSTLGGAGGCGAVITSTVNAPGGTSTFAGNGGACNNSTVAANSGSAPGGGGGGNYVNTTAGGNGASGSVRIYYV